MEEAFKKSQVEKDVAAIIVEELKKKKELDALGNFHVQRKQRKSHRV